MWEILGGRERSTTVTNDLSRHDDLSRIDKNIDFWRLKWANDLSRILDIFRPAGDLSHIFDFFLAARRRRRKIITFHGGNNLKPYFSAPAAGFQNCLVTT